MIPINRRVSRTEGTAYRRLAPRTLALVGAASALLATTHNAHAYTCNFNPQAQEDQVNNCVCYSQTPSWNVPPGSAVQTHTNGEALTNMFNAIGEYRTHTMFAINAASSGPGATSGNWMIHTDATTGQLNPNNIAQDIQLCGAPIVTTTMYQPGTAVTPDAFEYIYGGAQQFVDGNGSNSTEKAQPTFLSYQPPLPGNYGNGWGSGLLGGITGATDFGQGFSNFAWGLVAAGGYSAAPNLPSSEAIAYQAYWKHSAMTYSFNSFINGNPAAAGETDSFNGMFCAATGAFIQTNLFTTATDGQDFNFYAGGIPSTKQYSNAVIFGANSAQQSQTANVANDVGEPGVSAAYNLWEGVYQKCMSDPQLGTLRTGCDVACASSVLAPPGIAACVDIAKQDWPCALAANQVLNNVSFGTPNDNDFTWRNNIGNQSFVADAITDDTLTGWTGGPTNHPTGQVTYYNGIQLQYWQITPGASVWANQFWDEVQWNAEGATVDCVPTDAAIGGDVANGTVPTGDPNHFTAGN